MRAGRPKDPRFIIPLCFGVLAVVLCVMAVRRCDHFLRALWRPPVIGFVTYLIMFIFYGNGGRYISETFWVSLFVIAATYFVITSSWCWFLAALALCFLAAATVSL
jgi:hypothetical protein